MYKTTEYLISPSLAYFPILYREDILIHLITIHDHPSNATKPDRFDFESIQRLLSDIPLLQGQRLRFMRTDLSLLECSLCSAAKFHSLKVIHPITCISSDISIRSSRMEFQLEDSLELLDIWILRNFTTG